VLLVSTNKPYGVPPTVLLVAKVIALPLQTAIALNFGWLYEIAKTNFLK
jgi:hypothetical protein